MHLLNSNQIREWDAYTIQHEPITSEDLMERAASELAYQIQTGSPLSIPVQIFCGPGNNGGDGLVIARKLKDAGFQVEVFIPSYEGIGYSHNFSINLERLQKMPNVSISTITELRQVSIRKRALILDCLFGTKVRWPLPQLVADLIGHINAIKTASQRFDIRITSIDIPSGLNADFTDSVTGPVIQADQTLTLQILKPSFLLPDTGKFCGDIEVVDIRLDPHFNEQQQSGYFILEHKTVLSLFKKRPLFSHKGIYGHALLIAGSKGKSGAAVLSAKGCLHSGAGLVTVLVPSASLDIVQSQVPEAMAIVSEHSDYLSGTGYDLASYSSIGIGPGLGTNKNTKDAVLAVIKAYQKPMVIDADALNILSEQGDWTSLVYPGSILTPHPGEFDRLAGKSSSSYDRIRKQKKLAETCRSVLILKGAFTSIAFPDGSIWFNTTGNPGMATGGSGDTLTGILTALLGAGYTPEHSALIGVFVHGQAGDIAAQIDGQTFLSASMISDHLSYAFKALEENGQFE